MKFLTIAFDAKGKAKLLHGPEVPPAKQRKTVQGFRGTGLPDGVDRVEIWERNCIKVAVRQPELPLEAPAASEAQGEPKAAA